MTAFRTYSDAGSLKAATKGAPYLMYCWARDDSDPTDWETGQSVEKVSQGWLIEHIAEYRPVRCYMQGADDSLWFEAATTKTKG